MKLFSTVTVLATLGLAPLLSAQRTWVIDSKRGPGSHFATIQQGVNAANPGDTLLVRSGAYLAFQVSKGLRIIGSPSATVYSTFYQPPIYVSGIPAGQTLTLVALTTSWVFNWSHILVSSCAGPVVFENVHVPGPSNPLRGAGLHGIAVTNSKAVTLNGCLVGYGVSVTGSSLMASDSVFRRYDVVSMGPLTAAISLNNADATLAGCVAVGEAEVSGPRAGPALAAIGSRVSIRGRSTLLAGSIAQASSPAVTGDSSSTLEWDPLATIRASGFAQSITGFARTRIKTLPALSVLADTKVGALDLEMLGGNGHFFVLYLSLPTVPVPVATFGDLWLDPKFRNYLLAGFHGPSGSTKLRVPVQASATLRGVPLAWQSVGGPWPAVVYSNAVVTTLR